MVRSPRFDRGRRWRAQQRTQQRTGRWGWLRPLLVLGLIALAWHAWNRSDVRSAIGLPLPVPQQVAVRFALCADPGYAANCVVDGDTFRLGPRRIRVQGIDAPEVHGACPAETAAAARATRALQAWLNAGPFLLDQPDAAPHDRYGRELQVPVRGADDAASHMVASGQAQPYTSGQRQPWC